MKHDQKWVSVIVPTKNSASSLEACLLSISKQTHPLIELLVIDNFSNDETPNIAKEYADKFYQKGPERSTQRNFGVKQATGEYVCIIDSDMELGEDVIAECIEAMRGDSSFAGVVIPEESFGKGFWAQCKALERSFYVGVPYMEAARFFKKDHFLKLGGYDTTMVSGEDWDLSQRIEAFGPLTRAHSFIRHNEGHISLTKTIKKKMYYAQKFAHYVGESTSKDKVSSQTSLFGRYKLFLSQPRRLFRRPLYGIGMLFMKTCEFGFGGIGYLVAKIGHRS